MDCGWNPPADLNGIPALCCECPVAGEKFPSLMNPVWAVVPPWGVLFPGCGWKLPWPCVNCCPVWLDLIGAPPPRSWAECCCNLSCCWCCCINLNWWVNCWRTFCCCGVRFCVCWRQWSIWSCCWLRKNGGRCCCCTGSSPGLYLFGGVALLPPWIG